MPEQPGASPNLMQSNQEQAFAAWVNQVNQDRIDALLQSLRLQDVNLSEALARVDDAMVTIVQQVVEVNRGGLKGMHGFIAEIAEVGVGNARSRILGNSDVYEWVNNNGPADLLRDGLEIQQKFYASISRFGLNAIEEHRGRYPGFVEGGGRYQIPRDQFETVKRLLEMPADVASKTLTKSGGGPSFKDWERVQDFFTRSPLTITDLEPAHHDYVQVQGGVYAETLAAEKESLLETDAALRKEAYERSLPTVGEAAKVTAVGAVLEGATTFVLAVSQKRREGKRVAEFTGADWRDIAAESGFGTMRGGVRGLSIYALTNHTATPAAAASSLVTASFGIAEQAHRMRSGEITEVEFIENAEAVALQAAVSALSSFVGQAVIPIPVIGAVVGNTVGMVMYRAVSSGLSAKEAALVEGYLAGQQELDAELAASHKELLDSLEGRMAAYLDLLEHVFSPDLEAAFAGSVALALAAGVGPNRVLDTPEKVSDFFLR